MNTKLFVDWDGTIIQWDRQTKTSTIAWDNLEYIQRVVGETIDEVVIFSMGISDRKDAKAFLKNKSKLIAKAFPKAKVYVLPFYEAFMAVPARLKNDKYADMTIAKETMLEFYLRSKKVEGRVVFFDDSAKRVKTTLDFGTFNVYPVFGGYQYEDDYESNYTGVNYYRKEDSVGWYRK